MRVIVLEWRRNRKKIILWSVILTFSVILFLSFYPYMQNDNMKLLLEEKLHLLPKGIQKAFGLDAGNLTEIGSYFAYILNYLLVAVAVFAINSGQTVLIMEEVSGTIEYLYALPLTRRTIATEKSLFVFLSLLSIFVLLTAVSLLVYLFLGLSLSENQAGSALFKMLLGGFLVCFFFESVGVLISVSISKESSVTGIGMGIVFLSYLMGIVSSVVEKADFLKYFSPFQLLSPNRILQKGFPFPEALMLMTVSIILMVAAIGIYQKRDFLV